MLFNVVLFSAINAQKWLTDYIFTTQLFPLTADQVTLTTNADGNPLSVFRRNSDIYWAEKQNDNQWSAWTLIPNLAASTLALAKCPDGNVQIFALNRTGQIYTSTQSGDNFGDWKVFDQNNAGLAKEIQAGTWDDGTTTLLMIGQDDKLYRNTIFRNSSVVGWRGPSVRNWTDINFIVQGQQGEVFATENGSGLKSVALSPSGRSSSVNYFSDIYGPAASGTTNKGIIYNAAVAADKSVWYRTKSYSGWSEWIETSIKAEHLFFTTGYQDSLIFCVVQDGFLFAYAVGSNTWSFTEFKAVASSVKYATGINSSDGKVKIMIHNLNNEISYVEGTYDANAPMSY